MGEICKWLLKLKFEKINRRITSIQWGKRIFPEGGQKEWVQCLRKRNTVVAFFKGSF